MYEFAKDILLPLAGPAVAIVVPTIVFIILPRVRDRRRTALDLFTAYSAEEMRVTRNEVWAYFVSEVASDPQQRDKRFDQYLDYLSEIGWSSTIAPETMAVFQKSSRVLDYFVFVEACLRHRLANECLIRCFLAHFYLWWREAVMVPMRQRRHIDTRNPRCVPLWWQPLVNLDWLAGVPVRSSAAPDPAVRLGVAGAWTLPGVASPTVDAPSGLPPELRVS